MVPVYIWLFINGSRLNWILVKYFDEKVRKKFYRRPPLLSIEL